MIARFKNAISYWFTASKDVTTAVIAALLFIMLFAFGAMIIVFCVSIWILAVIITFPSVLWSIFIDKR